MLVSITICSFKGYCNLLISSKCHNVNHIDIVSGNKALEYITGIFKVLRWGSYFK